MINYLISTRLSSFDTNIAIDTSVLVCEGRQGD